MESSRRVVEGLCGPDLNRGVSTVFNDAWWNIQGGAGAYLSAYVATNLRGLGGDVTTALSLHNGHRLAFKL